MKQIEQARTAHVVVSGAAGNCGDGRASPLVSPAPTPSPTVTAPADFRFQPARSALRPLAGRPGIGVGIGCSCLTSIAPELRPNCECRDRPPDSREAYICTFECTYRLACSSEKLGYRCANCGGELVRRPVRVLRERPCLPAA